MTDFSLTGFATHLTKLVSEMPKAQTAALKEAAETIEKSAKHAIGSYEFGWKPLGRAAIAKHGDTPLLDSGGLRDSISHEADEHHALIGTPLESGKFQEFGTSRGIPPRPFLGGALDHSQKKIENDTGRLITAFIKGKGIKSGGAE